MSSRDQLAQSQRWPSLKIAIAIFLVAFSVRAALMLKLRPYDQTLRVEIQHLAYSIASGAGYANPYPTPTGPTALYSPGDPLILAGIYRAFGYGSAGEAVSCTLNIAAASTVFALIPLLAVLLGLPHRAGVIAAFAGAALPVYLLNEFHSTSATFGALCLISLTLMTAWAWNRGYPLSGRLGAMFGLAWGIALLISPNLLLVGLVWLMAAIYHYKASAMKFSLATLAVSLAVLAPWAIRNEVVLGSPIFSRSNFGLELWIANNDVAAANYGDNDESHNRYQPFINASEAVQLSKMGEAGYMHQRLNWATAWIEQHPQHFAALTADRFFHFWFPITYRPIQTAVVGLLSFAGIVGLVFAFVRRASAFFILGSVWLAYPLVYYLVQLDNPYRYPMYWSILLLASYGCVCTFDLLRRPSRQSAHGSQHSSREVAAQ